MNIKRLLVRCTLAVLAWSSLASATIIFDVNSTMTAGDPTQLGRLTRNGVPSDWSTVKAFPGVTNASTSVHYEMFSIFVGLGNFLQIDFDDPGAAFFVSAYLGSYSPNPVAANRGLDINYMGDAGFSGNSFGNPGFFQVVAPVNGTVILVVNDPSTTNAALGQSFHLTAESYIDTQFTDPPAGAPEPATAYLSLAGFLLLVVLMRRKRASTT